MKSSDELYRMITGQASEIDSLKRELNSHEHSGLRRGVKELRERVDRLTDDINTALANYDERIDNIEKRIKKLEKKI